MLLTRALTARRRLTPAARALTSILALSGCLSVAPAFADDTPLEELVVVDRLPRSPSEAVFSRVVLDQKIISTAPQTSIDEILGDIPGFGLFRRNSSLVAHPTTQGASLRGIGPNGAGRALVLVDGVPQNDPFGGWVEWGRIAPAIVRNVDVLYGGAVGAYANSALSGRIRIDTRLSDAPPFFFDGAVGNDTTVNTTAGVSIPVMGEDNHVFARGGYNTTDGYYILKPADRGSVDRPVNSDLGWGEVGGNFDVGENLKATVKASYFNEHRGNGTPLNHNSTDGYDLSASLLSYQGKDQFGWDATVFYQDREFVNQFSSVADDRNSENPALRQYSVPGSSVGGNVTLHVPVNDSFRLQMGADARQTSGSTNENYFWTGSQFVRERNAGGDQFLLGAFTEGVWDLGDQVTATLGGRVDYWQMTNGSRVETNLETDTVTLNERFDNRNNVALNARGAVEYRPTDVIAMRVSAYTGFRVPTINELYRPFRVRSDITEANPLLKPERLYGAEVGVDAQPLDTVKGSLVVFINRVDNAIANVLVTDQSGFYAPLGVFVPGGGTLSQRLNLDETLTKGVEASLKIDLSTGWQVQARYLYVDSYVHKASVDPSIVGNRLPQVASNQATFSLLGNPLPKWEGRLDMRVQNGQFDDLANTRRLGAVVTLDAYIGFKPREHVEVFGRVQNLFDRDIQTGISNGLISYGQPRMWQVGVNIRL